MAYCVSKKKTSQKKSESSVFSDDSAGESAAVVVTGAWVEELGFKGFMASFTG